MSTGWKTIVATPPGFPHTNLVRAASAAKQTAILSLEYVSTASALAVLREVAQYGVRFWVSVGVFTDDTEALLNSALYSGFSAVVLSDPASLRRGIDWCVDSGLEPIAEVTSLDEALTAATCRAAALIVKGNESGGRVGEETLSVLLQRVCPRLSLPCYARGGIGLFTAAAGLAIGTAGVVLDWQLALTEESALPESVKARIRHMDGSETGVLGAGLLPRYRGFAKPSETAYHALKQRGEEAGGIEVETDPQTIAAWRNAVNESAARQELLLLGQDAAFARPLAEQFRTVRGICQAIRREASRQVRVASRWDCLSENAPLAVSHGTRFPILQGPMTRVSDTPEFALAVSEAGALPFLALALMRGPQVQKLLERTRELLGTKPWGVGILGFVPKELRDEQLAEVLKCKPPFAIIAGGRPDMAAFYESEGIHVYLHVPSPELARSFLSAGARRLIFEGRECGGHVGPRTSFVLWEQMIRVILEHLRSSEDSRKANEYHMVFAGGIHDAQSAAMVAAIASPLAERGVRVGIVIGTGYLFTHEAVCAGAITPTFQEEAVACCQTILVESGIGHATRCAESAFGRAFAVERRRLVSERRPNDEIRDALEGLNLGRLRIASKGILRQDDNAGRTIYINADAETIRREGMFMIGQVAALREQVCSVEDLHQDASAGGRLLRDRAKELLSEYKVGATFNDSDVAVVGLSCILPKASDVGEYWQNILTRRYAIEEVPIERWDSEVYFDKDRRTRDKVYSRWGGFIDDVVVDPGKFGMPPASMPSIDPLQMLALEFVRRALLDAGYNERLFDREHTCCIVGVGGGVGDLGMAYGFRSMLPHYIDLAGGTLADSAHLIDRLNGELPEWTEDSFAGLLLNVVAGRVANRFDLGGTNYTVDAACATGLAAVRHAITELETHSSNLAIVAAIDTTQSPFGYLCFSKTQALSPTGQPRVFDETGDGIVVSEGVTVAILKRLEDALLDGDVIHGVIKSVGSSSDGKDKGLTAPRPVGQIRAFERAYQKAAFDPATVGMIEAHGTGTVVGDRTEAESLTSYFGKSGAATRSIALGSVKSMIGHAKCAAGGAGLIKALLAIRQRVLPPTIGVTKPCAAADRPESPLFVNTEARPWIRRLDGAPRRAGVSAFGFGGTNFHAVLEEFHSVDSAAVAQASVREWPAELFLWRASLAGELTKSLSQLESALADGARPHLSDLASAVYWERGTGAGSHCLAMAVTSLEDLTSKIKTAQAVVSAGKESKDPQGIYYSPNASGSGKIAFTFPGQGSQSVFMMNDLALAFPELIETLEEADASLGPQLGAQLSSFIYPPSVFSQDQRNANEQAIKQTNVAQPALGAVDMAMFRFLRRLGIDPEMACGHSYGEFAALCAAGVFNFPDLIRVSELRGRSIIEAASAELGTMAAVDAGPEIVEEAIAGIKDVGIANFNGPRQTVISGTQKGISDAIERLSTQNIRARKIPVACAFHSPLVAGAAPLLSEGLKQCAVGTPRFPVYSNTTAAIHPSEPTEIRQLLSDHLVKPVRFTEQILAMYEAGARVFIECGPGKVLTGLVAGILASRPHVAVAFDQPGRPGLTQIVHSLGQLAVAGVRFHASALFEGRVRQTLHLGELCAEACPPVPAPTAWIIRHGKAVPAAKNEKPRQRFLEPAARTSGKNVIVHVHGIPVNGNLQNTNALPGASLGGTSGTHQIPAAHGRELPHPVGPLQQAAENASPVANFAPRAQDSTIEAHHRLMRRFLETQRTVMMEYFGQSTSEPLQTEQAFGAPHVQTEVPLADVSATTVVACTEVLEAPWSGGAVAATRADAPPPHQTFSKSDVSKRLLEIVSQRTGYPLEMLGLEMDLEADLGIDSIKRVEILSALQENLSGPGFAFEGQIEALSTSKTLKAIVDWIEARASTDTVVSAAEPPLSATKVENNSPGSAEVARLLTELIDAPLNGGSKSELPKCGFVLITADDSGVAPALAMRLGQAGIANRVVSHAPESGVDLLNPASVESLVASLSQQEAVYALVHLTPLSTAESLSPESRTQFDLKSLFLLTKILETNLRSQNGSLLAATRLGGAFGFGGCGKRFAGNGAIAGFQKTIAREWPEVSSRTVDFEAGADPESIADALMAELFSRDGISEAGYVRGSRRTLLTRRSDRAATNPAIGVTRSSVVLVTGGARGITAGCALEIAKAYQPRMVLVGRSPLPAAEEPADIAGITNPRELKAALMDRTQTGGQRLTPALIEAMVKRVNMDRDIRANLAAFRAAGSEVTYHAVDVSNADAFGKLINSVYEQHGRIDGVIHGAGVIEDKLISDKTLDSFDRVVRAKVSAAWTLAEKLKPAELQFLAFFSSVSARYGNRGQCDYAAANEVLNKLAQSLNARWPGRVLSINWGPWKSEGGMLSSELEARFRAAGVQVIEPAVGYRTFIEELKFGRKQDVEVVFGGPLSTELRSPQEVGIEQSAAEKMPELALVSGLKKLPGGAFEAVLNTHPRKELFLQDHQIDGKPVLPMACALEICMEAAMLARENQTPASIHRLQAMQGVVYENGEGRKLRVEVSESELSCAMDVALKAHESGKTHYRAQVEFKNPAAALPQRLQLTNHRPFPLRAEECYRKLLFHGPRFAGIVDIVAMGDNGIIGRLKPSTPAELVDVQDPGAWLVDPVVTDSALQLVWLWAITSFEQAALPFSIDAYYRRASFSASEEIFCEVEIASKSGSPTLVCRACFYDGSGAVLGWMEGLRVTMSRSLNRLAGAELPEAAVAGAV